MNLSIRNLFMLIVKRFEISNFTVRRDDLTKRPKSEDKPVFNLLPHFDINTSKDKYLSPFDAIIVFMLEANGFEQKMQIGLTRKSNVEKGAAINISQVYVLEEIEAKSGSGYVIMQRQLEEDEWVIVHTASPIFTKNITANSPERCVMVINSCLIKNTELTEDYKKLPLLSDSYRSAPWSG